MKLYKLTNGKGQTYNNTQWGEGVTHESSGVGELCGRGWLHAYTDPILAVLLNPIHADFNPKTMQLWEAEGEIGKDDHGLKVGAKKLTTTKQIIIPKITTEMRVEFAIRCALSIYSEPFFIAWAENWISGNDRSREAARSARAAAWSAARSAWAAESAAWSAESAAWAGSNLDLIELANYVHNHNRL